MCYIVKQRDCKPKGIWVGYQILSTNYLKEFLHLQKLRYKQAVQQAILPGSKTSGGLVLYGFQWYFPILSQDSTSSSFLYPTNGSGQCECGGSPPSFLAGQPFALSWNGHRTGMWPSAFPPARSKFPLWLASPPSHCCFPFVTTLKLAKIGRGLKHYHKRTDKEMIWQCYWTGLAWKSTAFTSTDM